MLEMRRSPRIADRRATRLQASKTAVNRLPERRQVKKPIELHNHKRKTSPCEEEFNAMVQRRRPPPPQAPPQAPVVERPKPKLTPHEVLGMEPDDPRIVKPMLLLNTHKEKAHDPVEYKPYEGRAWSRSGPPLVIGGRDEPPVFIKHAHVPGERKQNANNCNYYECRDAKRIMIKKMTEYARHSYEEDWMYQ